MSRVRFVHAADLHLDAPFAGLNADPRQAPAVADLLRRSTFGALDALVRHCIERDADFLLLAGDVYNSADRSLAAQLAFDAAVRELAESGVRVFVAHGNHDHARGWSAGLALPENLTVFGTADVERHVVETRSGAVCSVYGISYARQAETSDLASRFRRDPSDESAIAVLHSNVGGQPGFEDYAPCALSTLKSSGMDYWALGHVHAAMTLCSGPEVRYAGCAQGLNPKETGPKGAWLVEMEGREVRSAEFLATHQLLWATAAVDLSACESLEDVRRSVRGELDGLRRDAEGSPLIARVDLTGRTPAHLELAHGRVLEDLLDDLRAQGETLSPLLWVDRLRDLTASPVDVASAVAGSEFLKDLLAAFEMRPEKAEALLAEVASGPLAALAGDTALELEAAEVLSAAKTLLLDSLLSEEGGR